MDFLRRQGSATLTIGTTILDKSNYSNTEEGRKEFYRDIKKAIQKAFPNDPEKQKQALKNLCSGVSGQKPPNRIADMFGTISDGKTGGLKMDHGVSTAIVLREDLSVQETTISLPGKQLGTYVNDIEFTIVTTMKNGEFIPTVDRENSKIDGIVFQQARPKTTTQFQD
jgi:hypothetical protein